MGYNDDYGFDFEDEDRDERQSPKALREAQKAAAKENKDLRDQLAKLTRQLAERSLKDVLEEKGLNPALGRFILKDDVDPADGEAVDAWIQENGSLFGAAVQPADAAASGGDEGGPDEETDPIAAEFARMQNAAANALPEGKFNEGLAALESATDVKSVQAALDKALRGANS